MIDRTATTVNLAKSILFGLDRKSLETPVQTQTLILLLDTLIDLGTPSVGQKVGDGAMRTVMAHTVAVNEAVKARG